MSRKIKKMINKLPKLVETKSPTQVDNMLWETFKQQVAHAIPFNIPQGKEGVDEYIKCLFASFHPKDTMEAMLLGQMTATHQIAMYLMARAALEAKGNGHQMPFTSAAVKLCNAYTRQMETLGSYRNRKKPQKIIVERVTVESGAQAVVGNITTGRNKDVI